MTATKTQRTKTQRTCECGRALHEPCSAVLDTDLANLGVTVYWMPKHLRESHPWPHNGSLKLYVHPDCAEMLESDGNPLFRWYSYLRRRQ